MILRETIAELIEPHIAEDDWGEGLHLTLADRILAIPEIAEALGNTPSSKAARAINEAFDPHKLGYSESEIAEALKAHTKPWQVTGDEPSLAIRDKD